MADETKDYEYNVEPAPERDVEENSDHELDEDEDQHRVSEPTEEDYERARTVGIGNEPELPPGVIRNK